MGGGKCALNNILTSSWGPSDPREKKLLVRSEDYGRDWTGVQNLRKKHKRLEAELGAHEPDIQVRKIVEKTTIM